MDTLPFVREAIFKLGYVNPQYDHTLAILLDEFPGEHPFKIARWFRSQGEPLSEQERRKYGIRKTAYFSRAAFDSLTERGKQNPLHALDITLLRASLSYLRAKNIQSAKDRRNLTENATVVLSVLGTFPDCHGCNRLNKQRIDIDDVAALIPPADCNREACAIVVMPRVEFRNTR
jgi:hypothetical protein